MPLTLIAEYESDQYEREGRLGTVERPDAWNFDCHGSPGMALLRGSWLRGDTLA